MINPLTWLSRHRYPYEPLITVKISRNDLIHNLNAFKNISPNGQVAPVLKSNAYGHGLAEVAKVLKDEPGIPFFVVDSYFEALALHSFGIKQQILVIGYTRPETIISSRLKNVTYTVTSLLTLKQLGELKHDLNIHIKIDTGMRRQGLLPLEINEAIQAIRNIPKLHVTGVCSHLCDADNDDPAFTIKQVELWNNIVSKFRSAFNSLEYTHLSATDGHAYAGKIQANVSRLGLGLYGLAENSNFPKSLDLKPVLEMKTIITGIKTLEPGETIGYSRTFEAKKKTISATVPVGYFEALDRRLSNCGSLTVGSDNKVCPIIGRISMNITSIDISNVHDAKIGTEVTVISSDPTAPNSINNMAKLAGVIPYEVVVHIPSQLRRVVVE